MENIPFLLGQLLGSLILILMMALIIKRFFLRKGEIIIRNGVSVGISVLITTIVYLLGPAKKFTITYLMVGLILFFILQIIDKRKNKQN